jgi:hypothetical protein
MQNEPNFQKSQMFITIVSTMNYSEKSKLDTWSKRTQTKPILKSASATIKLLTYLLINLINRYGFNIVLRVGTIRIETSAIRFNCRDATVSSIRSYSGGIRPAEYQNNRHPQSRGYMTRAGIIAYHKPGAF